MYAIYKSQCMCYVLTLSVIMYFFFVLKLFNHKHCQFNFGITFSEVKWHCTFLVFVQYEATILSIETEYPTYLVRSFLSTKPNNLRYLYVLCRML